LYKLEMDNYHLNWDKHETNIREAFCSLRKDKHFSDVTLACEDRQFQAHKVVLSASSSFFEQILKSHKHPSPLVYLKGVEAKHMELFLNFMYSGEVMLKQEELERFLKTGAELGLRGLTISETLPNSNSSQNEVNYSSVNTPSTELVKELPKTEAHSPAKWSTPSPVKIGSPSILSTNPSFKSDETMKCGDVVFGTVVKSENFDTSHDMAPNYQIDEWQDLKNYVIVDKKSPRAKAIYKCSLCEKIMNHAEAMIRHIESKHFRDAFTHPCPVCENTFETRAILNSHKQKEHKIIP